MVATATLTLGSCAVLAPAHYANRIENGLGFSNKSSQLGLNLSCLKKSLVLSKNSSLFPVSKAVSVDSDQVDLSEPVEKEKRKKYHFLVANAKFMLDEEEHFQEQLFERLRLFKERNMEQDFWLVIEPKFLSNFPNVTKRLKRPAVALVSTNATWITFMKLRLDRVLEESFEADSLEEVLAHNPTNLEFEKPEKWVAPYPKYKFGWWEPFLPHGPSDQSNA